MKGFFKTIHRDTVLSWSFWMTIVFLILMVGGIAASFTNLPPFIPLYNHMPWGYARLGKTYEIFILPLVIIILCACNSFIGVKIVGRAPLLARFLFLTTACLALFTFIFIGRLIFITL